MRRGVMSGAKPGVLRWLLPVVHRLAEAAAGADSASDSGCSVGTVSCSEARRKRSAEQWVCTVEQVWIASWLSEDGMPQ